MTIDRQDLTQAGILAMIEAAQRYDPGAGQFWPFVKPRIQGAMLNYVHKEWPHLTPQIPPLRAALDLQHLGNLSSTSAVSRETGSPVRVPDSGQQVSDRLDLDRAAATLTRQERLVVRLVYLAGHNQREAARRLKITEQRAGQLRVSALRRMRREMAA